MHGFGGLCERVSQGGLRRYVAWVGTGQDLRYLALPSRARQGWLVGLSVSSGDALWVQAGRLMPAGPGWVWAIRIG